jgi:hypothetical protein
VLTRASEPAGINVTSTPTVSNRDTQSAFTSIISRMKQDGSNWSTTGPPQGWAMDRVCMDLGFLPFSEAKANKWNQGRFHRVEPAKAGTFDCTPSNCYTFSADLTTP